jgi:tetratricopeptide (TPR) repeat protein
MMEGVVYANIGNTYLAAGNFNVAEEHHLKALAIYGKTGQRRFEANSLANLGTIIYRRQLVEGGGAGCQIPIKALEFYERSIAINREAHDRENEGDDRLRLGAMQIGAGDFNQGIDNLQKALTIYREFKSPLRESLALRHLAGACLEQGDCSGAYSRLTEASEKLGENAPRSWKYAVLHGWINYHLRTGDFKAARETFEPIYKDWQDGLYVWPFHDLEIKRILSEIEKGEQEQLNQEA